MKKKTALIIFLSFLFVTLTAGSLYFFFEKKYKETSLIGLSISEESLISNNCNLQNKECSKEFNMYLLDNYFLDSKYYFKFVTFQKGLEEILELSIEENFIEIENNTSLLNNSIYRAKLNSDFNGNITSLKIEKEDISADKDALINQIINNTSDNNLPVAFLDFSVSPEYKSLSYEFKNSCIYELKALEKLTDDTNLLQTKYSNCIDALNNEDLEISYIFRQENNHFLSDFAKKYNFETPKLNSEQEITTTITNNDGNKNIESITVRKKDSETFIKETGDKNILYTNSKKKENISYLSDMAYLCKYKGNYCNDINSHYKTLVEKILTNDIPSNIENISLLTKSLLDVQSLLNTTEYDKDIEFLLSILFTNNIDNYLSFETNLLINTLAEEDEKFEILANNLAYKNHIVYTETFSTDISDNSKSLEGILKNNQYSQILNLSNIINIAL